MTAAASLRALQTFSVERKILKSLLGSWKIYKPRSFLFSLCSNDLKSKTDETCFHVEVSPNDLSSGFPGSFCLSSHGSLELDWEPDILSETNNYIIIGS